jgi:uncharacterized protein YecE (DUF72 family)
VALIGTAGWAIPAQYKAAFPATGTQLERYAARLTAVEINSSFYRPHQHKTYARWAAGVPDDFRFSVKLPRSITQDKRLRDCDTELARFCGEIAGLGSKLGVVLVQLPPSLVFDSGVARAFFPRLQGTAAVVCEPRHASWFAPDADALLQDLRVARVAADPPRASGDGMPGGWTGMAYWRLHGSPKIYYSDYPEGALQALAPKLRETDWCIFDNTAAFAALGNALRLTTLRDA